MRLVGPIDRPNRAGNKRVDTARARAAAAERRVAERERAMLFSLFLTWQISANSSQILIEHFTSGRERGVALNLLGSAGGALVVSFRRRGAFAPESRVAATGDRRI